MCRPPCTFALVLGCLFCLVSAPFLRAEKHERKRVERAEISALEERCRQAQLAEDTATMDRLLSDEFLGITATGQLVTKAQQLDHMRTRRMDLQRMDLSDTKIKISGNLAVVTSLAMMEGTADGKPLRGSYRYTRVYHRVGRGDWKITNFEATRVPEGGSPWSPQATSGAPLGGGSSYLRASPAVSASLRPPS